MPNIHNEQLLLEGEILFEYFNDVYFFKKDTDLNFVGCNGNFVKLVGLESTADIKGRNDYDFFPTHLADRYRQDDIRVMKSGEHLVNRIEINSTENEVRWFQTTKVPLYDGENRILGVAGFARDMKRTKGSMLKFDHLQPALDHIEEHLTEQLEIEFLSKICHMSISQFERKFKSAMLMTPMAYIIKLRLDAASRNLLESKTSILEIAHRYGFYDNSHFTRQFRKEFKLTPRDFRKANASKNEAED
ncbi:MAG: AraC family transcriptional regulator [Planctomycetes bacterium]|nr:AraC family transcriptional regulator [Planctomycetota bacterium]